MAFSNKMTELLDKIERRLGTKPINLPPDIAKSTWVKEVIIPDTLSTFSRFFPHKFPYVVDTKKDKKDGYYFIDEDKIGNIEILGIRDINWQAFSHNYNSQISGYGTFGIMGGQYSLDDIGLVQMGADHMSLFNNGIFIEWESPNKIKLVSTAGLDIARSMTSFTIDLFLKHPDNLMTIAPTKMEIFEDLARADVAMYLYQYLKFYDGLETVYANIDLKMDEWQTQMNRRDDIVQQLKDGYVSMANDNQPAMFCI